MAKEGGFKPLSRLYCTLMPDDSINLIKLYNLLISQQIDKIIKHSPEGERSIFTGA